MSDRILSIRSSTGVSEGVAEPGGREPQGNSPPENAPETAGPDKTLLPFEDRKRHLLWIWIPVVIGLGLLIAAGYVGGRVWTSKPEAAPVAQTTATVAPAATEKPSPASEITPVAPAVSPAAPTVSKVTPAVSNAAPADSTHPVPVSTPAVIDPQDLDVITPQPGERYIQISALNTESARRYVNELRHGPLEPHLAPGPTENLLRVLIGPFKDTSSLLTARSDLLAAGIDCFIREY